MNVDLMKFSLADTSPQQVLGVLKGTGSRDPDVLFAAKEEYGSTFATQRFQGFGLLVVGALSSITIVLAIIGLPVALFGWWLWRKGVKNVATVETAFSGYLESMRAGGAMVAS